MDTIRNEYTSTSAGVTDIRDEVMRQDEEDLAKAILELS